MTKSNGNGSGRTAIHIALQGKGGVGKSLISAILSQYLSSKGQDVCGIDVDPVNQTFSEYRGSRVECLNLLREGSIDQREFDLLMERFLKEVGTFVVDTGASTFIPLWHYILENQALDHLRQKGKRVFIHSVITGGQSLNDTLSGFEALAETMREKNIVVWLNEYFGPGVARRGCVRGYAGLQEAREQAARVRSDRAANGGYLWTGYGRDDLPQTDLRRGREGGGFHDHDKAALVSRTARSFRTVG